MFSLNPDQQQRLQEWTEEQDAKVAVEQKARWQYHPTFKSYVEHGQLPYYGACGGAYTYSFTPTSIGVVVKVQHAITKEELDLTDYNF